MLAARDRTRWRFLPLALLLLGSATALAADPPKPSAGGGDAPRPVFLDIDRIVVSVYRGNEIVRHDMVAMKLELVDDTVLPKVMSVMPRLRNAFVREWAQLGAHPSAASRGIDLATGKQRMIAACARIVEAGACTNVLVQGISSRDVARQRARD
jgi:hypothetical protein